jgi:hypothetical protein
MQAKLLIRYMMEEEGFTPWNEPGDFAARSSLEAKQMEDFNLPRFTDLKLWPIDPEEIYYTKYGFLGALPGAKLITGRPGQVWSGRRNSNIHPTIGKGLQ